jgi:hypothetical protein
VGLLILTTLVATETFQPTAKAIKEHVAKLKRAVGGNTANTSSATTWTARRDQNLLLLLISDLKIDFSKLPESWARKYRKLLAHRTQSSSC